jgi:hypothetical protein
LKSPEVWLAAKRSVKPVTATRKQWNGIAINLERSVPGKNIGGTMPPEIARQFDEMVEDTLQDWMEQKHTHEIVKDQEETIDE